MVRLKYVEPVFFLYAITLFLNIPMERQLVVRKVCLNLYNTTFCHRNINTTINRSSAVAPSEENTIQAVSAKWFVRLNVARLIPSVFSSLLLGALSDQVGRKGVLWLATMGETLNTIGYFLNAWFISGPVSYLLIQQIVTGFSGNFLAILMAGLSYIGDVSDSESRTSRIIVVDVMLFVASVIAYTSGGVILQRFGFLAIYIIGLCLYGISMVYLVFLKESYQTDVKGNWKDVVRKITEFSSVLARVGRRRDFVLVLACFSVLFFIMAGIDDILILYLLHAPLTFKPGGIGFVLASESSARFFGALIVTLLLIKKFRWSDATIMMLSSSALIGYSLSLSFSKRNHAIFISTLWGLGTGAGLGSCRSSLSKMLSPSELGRLNSVLSILQSISLIVASWVSNSIYQSTVATNPSITLYVMGGICVIPLILSLILKAFEWNGYQDMQNEGHEEDDNDEIDSTEAPSEAGLTRRLSSTVY